jgi:hypothetical protein
MAFKTKTKQKNKNIDNRVTLDYKHKTKINEFKKKKEKIKEYKANLNVLELKLKTFKENKFMNDSEIEDKLCTIDKINELKNKILDNNKNNEIEYLLDTGNILFNYYDTNNNNNNKKTVSVSNFFKQNKYDNNNTTKLNYYNKYLQKIEDKHFNFLNNNIGDICEKCQVDKKIFLSEGKIICDKCGDESTILIDSDKPSFKDPPREICYFAYKRINHFNEWLAQFQAKESTDIPKEIYDVILLELKKERIYDISKLTQTKLREILKKLKKNKYYEHIPHIINKLNGIPPPIMTFKLEEELRRMFKEIQLPFHKHCPKDRKNFLSYSYVLHKFVQLLELDEFISCFVLLKSREKLHQQDQIWKEICKELKWQYIPSI